MSLFDIIYLIGPLFVVVIMLKIETLINQAVARRNMGRMKMSNPNEHLMLVFGFMVVVMWVSIAVVASYYSIVEERDITDSQLTVIGLLGGPALLIITSVLDLFKGKESAKINVLPDQLASDVAATESINVHSRMIEEMRIKHDLDMEKMQKAHELKMEEYVVKSGVVSDESE